VLYIINIPDGNAGGNISHLGGAIFGFVYSRLLRSGTDIGYWLEKLMDKFRKLLRPPGKFKVVHRKTDSASKSKTNTGSNSQDKIDSILDKISRSGYSSLTKSEKEILFNASKNKD